MSTTAPMVSPEQLSPEFLQQLMRQKQDKALGQWAEKTFKACKDLRVDVERQWYMNLAFYFGRQYLKPVQSGLPSNAIAFSTPPAPPWRVRMVVNRIRPIIRTEIAKLTANRPTAYVIPATGEEQDKAAAKAGSQIWEAAYRDLEVGKLLRRTLWWGTICGNAFMKSYWDQNKDDPSAMKPPSLKMNGMLVQPPPPGAVTMEVVAPFYILVPDLLCEDIEEQPYVFHSTIKNIEYVKRTYGITVNPSRNSQTTLINTKFLDIIGESTVDSKDGVLVHEIWIKPGGHKDFLQGGMLTVIDGQVVQRMDTYPYKHGMYPFAKFDHVQSGKFYSDSVLTDAIPIQRELNRTRSQIIENKNTMARPQLLAPKGSVNARKITSEPGQVIEYTPGLTPPSPLPIQSLPNYVLQEVDRLIQDLDDVSGQHEITRGQNPSQVTAYSALSYLQEQDESKLAASVASVEEFMEKLARLYLKYVVYFWDLPRTVRVVGRDRIVDATIWKGSDLRGNTDIRVEPGSAIPLGSQAKRAFLLDLFKLGAIDPSMLFELLDMNDLNDANAEFMVDKNQATRENMVMMEAGDQLPPTIFQPNQIDPRTGQPIGPQVPQQFLPHSWDNHEAHIHYHNQYRKSQEFEMASDTVKQLFEYHVTLHMQALAGIAPTATSPTGEPDQQVADAQSQQQGMAAQSPDQQQAVPGGETTTQSVTQPKGQGQ